ncbi:unnamed protein product, partial [marine sediment metagenome]
IKLKKEVRLKKTMFNWAIGIGGKYKQAEGILNNTLPLFDKADYAPERNNPS